MTCSIRVRALFFRHLRTMRPMRGTGRPSRTPACTFNSVSVGTKQRNVRKCSVKAAAAKVRCSSLRVLSLPGREFGGNPYIKLFCDSLERAGIAVVNIHTIQGKYLKFDVLHIHWPEFYITERPIYTAMALAPTILFYMVATKLLRKKIVWTIHDVPPMRPRHARLLQLYLLCVRVLVDAYVFMSPSSEAEFVKIFPRTRKKKVCHVPHGPYPVSATSRQRQAELTERLSWLRLGRDPVVFLAESFEKQIGQGL